MTSKNTSPLSPLLWTAGAAAVLIGAFSRMQRDLRARQWSRKDHANAKTALITGASSGIGAAFARRLAEEGYDLVLLARREDRLRSLAAEIQARCPVKVETMKADLSDPADVARVAALIEAMENLTLLVNNAGFGTGGNFASVDLQPELNMIQVHVLASVQLTRAALPGMIARGHGGIINVSSMGGFAPMPGSATYGATKAYLNSFTESLQAELEGTGVRVQALCPGMTITEFHDRANFKRSMLPSFIWMDAEPVVEASLQGLREGKTIVVPGLLYKLAHTVLTSGIFDPLVRLVVSRVHRT